MKAISQVSDTFSTSLEVAGNPAGSWTNSFLSDAIDTGNHATLLCGS